MSASRRRMCAWSVAAAVGAAVGSAASGQVTVRADLIAKVGDVLPGSGGVAVMSLRLPRVSPSGGVAFIGLLADQRCFLCVDGQIVYIAPFDLESMFGLGPGGAFVVSPPLGGTDSLITESGTIATLGAPIPGAPGQIWSPFFRPTITGDGRIVFAHGSALFWSIWSRQPSGAFTRHVGTGDSIGGFTLGSAPTAGAGYAVSPDGQHLGAIVHGPTGQSLLVDGQFRAAFGSATGSPVGDQWRAHSLLFLSNSGDYLHAGRTTSTSGNDYVLALNGRVRARSGDMLGTRDVVPASTPVGEAGITSRGIALFRWGSVPDMAMYAGHAPVLGWRSTTVFRAGDGVDTNGDGAAEWAFTGQGFEDASRHLEADALDRVPLLVGLRPAGGTGLVPAIVRVTIPVGYRCPGDFNHDGRVDPSDVAEMVREWSRDVASGIATTDYDLSDTPTPGDVTTFVQVWFGSLGGC